MGGARYGPGPAVRGSSQQWQGKPAQAVDAHPAPEYHQPREPVGRDSVGRQVDFVFALLYIAKGIRIAEVTSNDCESSEYIKHALLLNPDWRSICSLHATYTLASLLTVALCLCLWIC